MDYFKAYIKELEQVIVNSWEMGVLSPLESFIQNHSELYSDEFIEMWKQANEDTKMLTLCKLTLNNTRKSVRKYHERAIKWVAEMEKRTKNKINEQYDFKETLLVKDFKPKYKWLEVVEMDENGWVEIPYNKPVKLERVIKDYSNRQVLSIKDYHDTKTTSIVISYEDN